MASTCGATWGKCDVRSGLGQSLPHICGNTSGKWAHAHKCTACGKPG